LVVERIALGEGVDVGLAEDLDVAVAVEAGAPARFVELRRIERAQALLATSSLPIGAIADATGFSSQFYFAARFRAPGVVSPSEFRRRGDRRTSARP
jgi:transcriptional regulator GlxA family with amidase domain